MKILQINTVCGIGSTGRITVDIAHILKARGYQSCIAYGRGTAPKDVNAFRIDKKYEVIFHAMISRVTDKQGLYSSAATYRLIKKIKQYHPDIIHLHNIHGYYVNYCILFEFLKKYNVPIVWTFHDCWPFTGHCAYFDYVQCKKWEQHCFNCPQKKTYPSSYFLDNSKENYKLKRELFTKIEKLYIVTPSAWLADLVKKSFFAKKNIRTIHNGIDLTYFKPTESKFRKQYNLKNKKIILGVASPWSPRKGLNDFIKLSTLVDDAYQIVLVGVSAKQKKKLPVNIIAFKRTENQGALAGLYTTSDIFFNPTYEDNYPTTNLESIACGTPVVTYCTGGSPETINKKTGCVVEKGNVIKAWHSIKEITAHREKIVLSKEIKKNIDKKYLFEKYLKLYKEIYINNI